MHNYRISTNKQPRHLISLNTFILERQKKTANNKVQVIQTYKIIATESNVAIFTFLKLILVKNDRHLLYLPYQLRNYESESCSI